MNDTTSSNNADDKQESFISRFIASTEIDPRLLGMLGALALIWFGFHFYGVIFNNFGAFLTPRN